MSLEIYIGPMYAGKTTRLINMYNREIENSIIIDYNINNISNDNTVEKEPLFNHDKMCVDGVYRTKKLNNLYNIDNYSLFSKDILHEFYSSFILANTIYINECQFFPDLKNFVLRCMKNEINVKLFGLDADFKQELFGQTFDLIPYCSHIEKIQGKCNNCKNNSIVSHRITENKSKYLPDCTQYIPLCLECYNKY